MTSRGGAVLLRSVSLFLASGRRASSHAVAATAAPAAAAAGGGNKKRRGGGRRRARGGSTTTAGAGGRGGAMGDEGKFLDGLRKKTHFTRQEMEALCRAYRSLGGDGGVDRVAFRELLHNTFDLVTEDVLLERVFSAFDRGNDGVVRLEEWLQGLSVFLRGTPRERTAFCFLVYDLNADGFVTRDEMFQLLRNCLVKHPGDEDPDEGVKDLVELALRKLDRDRDGKVSFQDFQAAVDDEPLLLEAFGQCLPADGACHTFLQTLQ